MPGCLRSRRRQRRATNYGTRAARQELLQERMLAPGGQVAPVASRKRSEDMQTADKTATHYRMVMLEHVCLESKDLRRERLDDVPELRPSGPSLDPLHAPLTLRRCARSNPDYRRFADLGCGTGRALHRHDPRNLGHQRGNPGHAGPDGVGRRLDAYNDRATLIDANICCCIA